MQDGSFAELHLRARGGPVWAASGEPSAPRVCIDPHGYDAGKKIKGKKRHILVDTLAEA
jgi:hypothetical protein